MIIRRNDSALAANILELIIVLPVILLTMKKVEQNAKLLALFCCFFLFNHILLLLPIHYDFLRLVGGRWNWSGKIHAVVGSIAFYLIFSQNFKRNDFVTAKQKEGSLIKTIITTGVVLLVVAFMSVFFWEISFSMERLGFQLTIPGVDEELAYRGVMLGILATLLRDQVRISRFNLGHPGVWITAILFGLIHGFDEDWQLDMNWFPFGYSFLFG